MEIISSNRPYVVLIQYRTSVRIPEYLTEEVTVNAPTAEDAITIVKIANQEKLELKIMAIKALSYINGAWL